MGRRPIIDLFCEDSGHETFARALVNRLAGETTVPRPTIQSRSARGGHGRAVTELGHWQRTLRRGASTPDLLLVLIDANGDGWTRQRRNVEDAVEPGLFPNVIVACPDPHVEAWCAADLDALASLTGRTPPRPPGRPGRLAYKLWLRDTLDAADIPILNDPMDIAPELVQDMDLFRATKESPSLGHLIGELTGFFRRSEAQG